MVCYKGGLAVETNFQMCDVTNRKIIDTIPDNKPPQVTFSCSAGGPSSNKTDYSGLGLGLGLFGSGDVDDPIEQEKGVCNFQFWVDRIESFYCKLEECSWNAMQGADGNETHYTCEKMNCACVPGRFLCGENGSVSEPTS